MTRPAAETEITPALASALVATQFPDLAGQRIGERFEGWDNVTYRLGESLAVRLPRLAVAAELAAIEHTWLPSLATAWDFAATVPVHVGEPGLGYPWAWSVVAWIDGDLAADATLASAGRRALGRALAQVHQPSPADAPVCPWRATPLAARRDDFATALERVGAGLAGAASVNEVPALAEYDHAAALPAPAPVWIHADLHALNLLTRDGDLAGIIDWGEMSGGDFAQDLGQAWVLVGEQGFADVLAAYGRRLTGDDAARVRGHALDTAVRLAGSPSAAHREPGLRALGELGLLI